MQNDKAKLKALETLVRSRGWAVLVEVMNAEILASARSMGDSASMATDEVHFRRGAIFAADRLIKMPELLINNLGASILFEEAVAQHDPQHGAEQ